MKQKISNEATPELDTTLRDLDRLTLLLEVLHNLADNSRLVKVLATEAANICEEATERLNDLDHALNGADDNLILHAYIQQKLSGDWEVTVSANNCLPVVHSIHYSRHDAKKEAARIGAARTMIVDPESVSGPKVWRNIPPLQAEGHDAAN